MSFLIPCFIVLTGTGTFSNQKEVMVNAVRITKYSDGLVVLHNGKHESSLYVKETAREIKKIIKEECGK